MTVLESNPRTGGRKFPLCNRRVADHHPFQNLHALANRSIEPETEDPVLQNALDHFAKVDWKRSKYNNQDAP